MDISLSGVVVLCRELCRPFTCGQDSRHDISLAKSVLERITRGSKLLLEDRLGRPTLRSIVTSLKWELQSVYQKGGPSVRSRKNTNLSPCAQSLPFLTCSAVATSTLLIQIRTWRLPCGLVSYFGPPQYITSLPRHKKSSDLVDPVNFLVL